MAKRASSPTRVASDVASGAWVTPTANRTVTEQINYWARIGTSLRGGKHRYSSLQHADRRTARLLCGDGVLAPDEGRPCHDNLVTTAVAAGYDMHDHSHPSVWHLTR